MDTNFLMKMALGPIDTLEELKKQFPHNISFWVRVNGEVWGELPPDMRQAAQPTRPRARKTDRPFTDWDGKYQFSERLLALRPGESLSIRTESPKHADGVARSMQYRAAKVFGAENVSSRCAQSVATIIRGA